MPLILFLYNIPTACLGVIVVAATMLVALLGYAIASRLKFMQVDAEHRAMALTMVSIITTINSLLVAFAAINVWDAYNNADHTVAAEAACAGELARDLVAFESPQADAASRALRVYVRYVIDKEWPVMQQSLQADAETEGRFHVMFDRVNRISPVDARQTVLLGELLARVNEMAKLRQQRLQALEISMPNTLWVVMLVVSALSFALLYVLPYSHFHVALISTWSATLGLAFFFVLAVDRPYAGEVSVSPTPFQNTIDLLIENHIWLAFVAA